MELDSVSFLFDKSEMIVLLRLLKCENILFPPREDEIDAGAAMERLREDYLISGSQEALVVDKVIAFLLRAMDGADFCLYSYGGGYVALFRTELANIVFQKRCERWIIVPFQSFAEARNSLLSAMQRLQAPYMLMVCDVEGTETLRFQTAKAMIKAAEGLLPVEREDEREKWKP